MCPLIFLTFGVVLFRASALDLLFFWTPSFFGSVLTFRMLSKRRRSLLWSHIYEVAMAPYIALSALVELLFARPIPFRVTPKGTKSGSVSFSWRAALPQILLLVATFVGWFVAGHILIKGDAVLMNSLLINLAWSVYNFTAIAVSILVCLERPRQRASERLEVSSPVAIRAVDEAPIACSVLDLSEDGAHVQCRRSDYPGPLAPEIQLDIENVGMIEGDIVWTRPDQEVVKLGIRFSHESDAEYRKIVRFVADHNQGYHPDQNPS